MAGMDEKGRELCHDLIGPAAAIKVLAQLAGAEVAGAEVAGSHPDAQACLRRRLREIAVAGDLIAKICTGALIREEPSR